MKEALVKILKEKDGFVSGEEIGARLGISRSAVWKNINALRKDGFIIESVSNKGYRLADDGDILYASSFEGMGTKLVGRQVLCYDSLPSTNDEAKRIAPCAAEGTAVIANTQTKGKGRFGREWENERNKDIAVSIILKPDVAMNRAAQVTLLAGIAAARAVSAETGLGAGIKWPNDVVLNNKKICGILTELQSEIGSVNTLVVGIGINVNSRGFSEEIRDKATSLLVETGRSYKRSSLLIRVFNEFDGIYSQFLRHGFASFREEYKGLCVNIGRELKVIRNKAETAGTGADITEGGELVVRTRDGQEITVFSGEVSVRGLYGYI